MCGVIGYISSNGSDEGLKYIQSLLKESSIRGLHGTGISFVKGDRICTFKKAESLEQCQEDIEKIINVIKPKALIAHVRYSTSNFDYPQPIASDKLSVVHNGVISQEPSHTWRDRFGYSGFTTENDSEILFKVVEAGHYPFDALPRASIAACVLQPGKLTFFRNGKRPLWYSRENGFTAVASTEDILIRSGLSHATKAFASHTYTCTGETLEVSNFSNSEDTRDLQ